MWDVVLDVFWPSKESGSLERVLGKKTKPDELRVELSAPGALKQRLNESGWLTDEVIAADIVRQGKPPTVLGLITRACVDRGGATAACKVAPARVRARGDCRSGARIRDESVGRGGRRNGPRGLDSARRARLLGTGDGAPHRSNDARRLEGRNARARGPGAVPGQLGGRRRHREADRAAQRLTADRLASACSAAKSGRRRRPSS
jgi:hypothetical protein